MSETSSTIVIVGILLYMGMFFLSRDLIQIRELLKKLADKK